MMNLQKNLVDLTEMDFLKQLKLKMLIQLYLQWDLSLLKHEL